MQHKILTFLVFPEADKLLAQCVEHDICVAADDVGKLVDRINQTVEAEIAMTGGDLSQIGKTPDDILALIEQRVRGGAGCGN